MKNRFHNYIIFLVILFLVFCHYSSAQFNSFFDFVNLAQTHPDFFEPFKKIKMEESWNVINKTNPLRFVKIGIIDSGLDAFGERHPEFRGVDLGNTSINAKIDTEPADIPGAAAGHGTQVAGIIGANNLSATSSANYRFPHMNGILSGVQNLNYTLEMRKPTFATVFTTDAWSVFAEMNKLVGEGVDIINISSGTLYLPLIHDIWFVPAFALLDDVLFVVSAGNDDRDAGRQTPANYGDNFNNVITVAATELDDTRMSSSNFGSAVNIAAPGLPIYAPAPRGKGNFPPDTKDYDNSFGGTSASAPMVTGVAGLIKAIKPDLTPSQIKQILIETGDPISTDKPIGPRLNAYKAVCHPSLGLNCAPPAKPLACPLSPFTVISEDSVIHQDQSPCVIQGILTILSGITLSIDPGVVIKFASHGSRLIIQGTLNANGTASQPIYFTSLKDDSVGGDTNGDGATSQPAPQDWRDIVIDPTGTANLVHSVIRFGGNYGMGLNVAGGNLSLTNSRLTQNSANNLYVSGGIANITSSEIDHSGFGIWQLAGTVTVNQSSVHDNISYGAYALGSPIAMNAQNNFWGDSTGPYHLTLNPDGLGNAVSDNVLFTPWLTSNPVGELP